MNSYTRNKWSHTQWISRGIQSAYTIYINQYKIWTILFRISIRELETKASEAGVIRYRYWSPITILVQVCCIRPNLACLFWTSPLTDVGPSDSATRPLDANAQASDCKRRAPTVYHSSRWNNPASKESAVCNVVMESAGFQVRWQGNSSPRWECFNC